MDWVGYTFIAISIILNVVFFLSKPGNIRGFLLIPVSFCDCLIALLLLETLIFPILGIVPGRLLAWVLKIVFPITFLFLPYKLSIVLDRKQYTSTLSESPPSETIVTYIPPKIILPNINNRFFIQDTGRLVNSDHTDIDNLPDYDVYPLKQRTEDILLYIWHRSYFLLRKYKDRDSLEQLVDIWCALYYRARPLLLRNDADQYTDPHFLITCCNILPGCSPDDDSHNNRARQLLQRKHNLMKQYDTLSLSASDPKYIQKIYTVSVCFSHSASYSDDYPINYYDLRSFDIEVSNVICACFDIL